MSKNSFKRERIGDFMKYLKMFFLVICLSVLLSACGYKTYYSETAKYGEIWELAGLSAEYTESSKKLFPESVDNLTVNDLFCRYDENLPLGESFQILLEVKYINKSKFDNEIDRISQIAYECDKNFLNNSVEAFASRMDKNTYFEYALTDKDSLTVYYVYLQNIDTEDIEIDSCLLPDSQTLEQVIEASSL